MDLPTTPLYLFINSNRGVFPQLENFQRPESLFAFRCENKVDLYVSRGWGHEEKPRRLIDVRVRGGCSQAVSVHADQASRLRE